MSLLLSRTTLLPAILVTTGGCHRDANTLPGGFSPEEAFHLFAGIPNTAPVPKEVRELQAAGAVWMDMHVLCRFRAPTDIIDQVLTNGYRQTSWDKVMTSMHPKNYTEHFSPKWNPDGISVKECYLKRDESTNGTDVLTLVVDRRSGVVYVVAEGEVH